MIVGLFLTLLEAVASLLFALLPNWTPFDFTVPSAGWESYNGPIKLGAFFDQFIPLSEGLTLVLLLLGVYSGWLAYKSAVWFLTKLHVLGGGSE